MGQSGPEEDPDAQRRQAHAQIRQALADLRENVVRLVMRRNALQDEVARQERSLADMDAKAALADKINNAGLAEEIRAERRNRQAELERVRLLLARAEAEAATAKIQLPEEEANLTRQVAELNAQFIQGAGARLESGGIGLPGSEADRLWESVGAKVRSLENEASARGEVASAASGNAPPKTTPPVPEKRAEELLAELERRLGLTSEPGNAASAPYLELEDAPPSQKPPALPPETTTETDAVAPAKTWNVARSKGESSRMEPTQRVRVAGIGTGSIFRGAHLPAYPEIPQVQLVALCDPDKDAQDLAYKRYQGLVEAKIKWANDHNDVAAAERLERDLETVQICDDISEVIESVKPDLVDICTQPFLHAPLSIQALEGGLNVMCEKPMARSWLETQRVIEAVKRTGKMYQHNENWLWDPDYYTAKKLVDAGVIGEPILMYLATAHGGPEGSPKFWNPEFGGGGALLDNGIHAIGASWFISGLDKKPTLVKAAQPFGMSIRMPKRILDGRYQDVRVDDDAHILIRFENPETNAWTTAHVEGSWSHRDSPDTTIIGTTGKIVFRSEEKRRLADVVTDADGKTVTRTYETTEGSRGYAVVLDAYERESRRIETSGPTWQPWPSSFYGEILNMVECIRHGEQTITGPEFGAECSAIVGAAYLSEQNGRRAASVEEFKAFAREIGARYGDDLKAADNALVEALLSAVRDKK